MSVSSDGQLLPTKLSASRITEFHEATHSLLQAGEKASAVGLVQRQNGGREEGEERKRERARARERVYV